MLRRTLCHNYKLVLVESPNKVGNVSKYCRQIADMSFGRKELAAHCKANEQIEVMPTIGHFQEMTRVTVSTSSSSSSSATGASPAEQLFKFNPEWTTTSQKRDTADQIVHRIRATIKSGELTEVILATDPDREGELISSHALHSLVYAAAGGNKKSVFFSRAYMHSITAEGVAHAMAQRKANFVDEHLADAASARHLLDRVFGFYGSRLVSSLDQKIRSVGRVQSPALILVADRCTAHDDIINNRVSTFGFSGRAALPGSTAAEHVFVPCNVNIRHKAAAASSTSAAAVAAAAEGAAGEAEGSSTTTFVTASSKEDAEKCLKILNDALAAAGGNFKCEVRVSKKTEQPPRPLTLQSLILELGKKHKLSSSETTEICQALFTGGHITYPRTDSHRISDENLAKMRAAAKAEFGEAAVATEEQQKQAAAAKAAKKAGGDKKEGNVEDAHEAIQPTNPGVAEPANLKSERERTAYKVIRAVSLASVMVPRKLETASVHAFPVAKDAVLKAAEKVVELTTTSTAAAANASNSIIKSKDAATEIYITFSARRVVDEGFNAALLGKGNKTQSSSSQQQQQKQSDDNDDSGAEADSNDEKLFSAIQSLHGKPVALQSLVFTERKPSPPPLFFEGTLIEELKRHGVGRPSTYSSIMKTLHNRGYVVETGTGKRLRVTETGAHAVELARRLFPQFVSLGFTSEMEGQLDKIGSGEGEVLRDHPSSRCLAELFECTRKACADSYATAAELTQEEQKSVAGKLPPLNPVASAQVGENGVVDFDKVLRDATFYLRRHYRGVIINPWDNNNNNNNNNSGGGRDWKNQDWKNKNSSWKKKEEAAPAAAATVPAAASSSSSPSAPVPAAAASLSETKSATAVTRTKTPSAPKKTKATASPAAAPKAAEGKSSSSSSLPAPKFRTKKN